MEWVPVVALLVFLFIKKSQKTPRYVHLPGASVDGAISDLTLGAVYKVLPTSQHESDAGLLRIIDNSGEDYLYPASYFQPLDWSPGPAEQASGRASLTIQLDLLTKAILRAEALAAHKSMGALVRQWIEERLELLARRG
jgi:hypothetical protein